METIFQLRIELGNEAMRSGEDIARALRDAANQMERAGVASLEGWFGWNKSIRDLNGNTVGSYGIAAA